MPDPFIPVIVSSLETYSAVNGLGWTVLAQDSPNRKEWNPDTAFVIVAPSEKTEMKYIAFGLTTTTNGYDVFLVSTGNLASDFDNLAQNLFGACKSQFMPQNSALYAAGAYMTRVVPKYDYDRSGFPKGWSSSCVGVNVYYVNPD